MNILRKKIIGLFVVSCLVLTACGGNASVNDTTQNQANNTTIQENIENTVISEQSQESETTQTEETTLEEVEHLTASDVLEILKANNNNIGAYIEYTEETDTNNLLGRPSQYTSKINGADTRLEQTDENSPKGFSIEVFNNNEDALARQEYINQIGEQMPMLVEYNYVNDYILLRVDKSLTPTQAQEYETIIKNIFD